MLADELTKKQKILAIRRVLNAESVDIDTLRQLAISRGGLLSDELRLQAWPKLLSVDVNNIPPKPGKYEFKKKKYISGILGELECIVTS